MVKIDVQTDAVMEELKDLADDQLPFATALALTRTVQAGQEDTRQLEGQVFKLRNDWTTQQTKITAATKQNLTATVYTDTSNNQSGAPDYLERQSEGGERVPVQAGGRTRNHIAIPTKALRQMIGDRAIPDWIRPRACLKYAEGATAYEVQRGKLKGQFRAQPKLVRGFYFFKVQMKSGAWAILMRQANDVRDAAVPIYILVTQASIRKRFPMEETVEATVQREFETEFKRALISVHTDIRL